MKASAFGIGQTDLHPFGLQGDSHPGKCPARAYRTDETVDAAIGLRPDLRPGGFDMGQAVGHIVKLIGPDRTIRLGARQSFRQTARIAHIVVGVAVGHRRHLHQFGPGQPDHVFLFLALGFGNHDHRAKPHRRAHQCQPDAGVTRRAFDDRAAGFELTLRHRIADDIKCGPVLDRLAGIEKLAFAQNRAPRQL